MKSTKQSTTAFLLKLAKKAKSVVNNLTNKKPGSPISAPTSKGKSSKPIAPISKSKKADLLKKEDKKDLKSKIKKTISVLADQKSKPVRLADLLKPKNEKNYASFITKEPKVKLKNILVAQPQPEAAKSAYYDLAAKYKIKFQFIPFITVEGLAGRDFRRQRITITDYNGVIFTSRNAIDHFFRTCEESRVKLSQETKFFCTSEAIALYLQKYTQYRKRKVFFGDATNNKELRALLLKHKDSTKCLYICPEVRSKDDITSFMDDNKIPYIEAVMYRTVPADLKGVDFKKYDMMVLFSPSSITSLRHNFDNFKQENLRIGIYGKTTADSVMEAKLKFHLMAPLDGMPSIVSAIENYIKSA